MKISVKILEKKQACYLAIALFKRTFRPGTKAINMTLENCIKAQAASIDMDCGANLFFAGNQDAMDAYKRIMARAEEQRVQNNLKGTNNSHEGWNLRCKAEAYAFYAGSLYL